MLFFLINSFIYLSIFSKQPSQHGTEQLRGNAAEASWAQSHNSRVTQCAATPAPHPGERRAQTQSASAVRCVSVAEPATQLSPGRGEAARGNDTSRSNNAEAGRVNGGWALKSERTRSIRVGDAGASGQ